MVIAAALGVFARLIINSPFAFWSLCQNAAPQIVPLLLPPPSSLSSDAANNNTANLPIPSDPTHRLVVALIDVWLDKFDSIGALSSRKLSALALCSLLTVPIPELLSRLDLFVAHITAVWFEVEGSGAEGERAFEFYTSVAPRDDDVHAAVNCEDAEGESNRRKALTEVDPVKVMRVSVLCRGKMEQAAAVHGAQVCV